MEGDIVMVEGEVVVVVEPKQMDLVDVPLDIASNNLVNKSRINLDNLICDLDFGIDALYREGCMPPPDSSYSLLGLNEVKMFLLDT